MRRSGSCMEANASALWAKYDPLQARQTMKTNPRDKNKTYPKTIVTFVINQGRLAGTTWKGARPVIWYELSPQRLLICRRLVGCPEMRWGQSATAFRRR